MFRRLLSLLLVPLFVLSAFSPCSFADEREAPILRWIEEGRCELLCEERGQALVALDGSAETLKRFNSSPVTITLRFDHPIAFLGAKLFISHHSGMCLWRVECGEGLNELRSVTGQKDVTSPCSAVASTSWPRRSAKIWRFVVKEDGGDPILHLRLLSFKAEVRDLVDFELKGEEISSLLISNIDGSPYGMILESEDEPASPSRPFDLLSAIRKETVKVESDEVDMGGLTEVLDEDKSAGVCRFVHQPAQLTLLFTQPTVLCGARAELSNGGPFRWHVECAANEIDLRERKRSYRCSTNSECRTTSTIKWKPYEAKVWRFSFRETGGDALLHLRNVQLFEPSATQDSHFNSPKRNGQVNVKLSSNAPLLLRVKAGSKSGRWTDVTEFCTWNSSDQRVISVDATGGAILSEPGIADLSAHLGTISSATLQFEVPPIRDLIVHCIERQPRYSRYYPKYDSRNFDEGFATHRASFVVEESSPNDAERWPKVGQNVKYVARVYNRGNVEINDATIRWSIDDDKSPASPLPTIRPGEYVVSEIKSVWSDHSKIIECFVGNKEDPTPDNNRLARASDALEFIFIVEEGFSKKFAAQTLANGKRTDSIAWWIQRHIHRFNDLLIEQNCQQSIAAGLLVYVRDGREDPPEEFFTGFDGRFPPRFAADSSDWRTSSGYYRKEEDIDYGFIHECAHQLGLIDLYQLNLEPAQNPVNNRKFRVASSLMSTCAPTISAHSAAALNSWLGRRRGYYGQYLYDLPKNITLALRQPNGNPVANARVKIYQKVNISGQRPQIAPTPKYKGTSNIAGEFRLPNSSLDLDAFRAEPMGNVLSSNPFGPLECVGTNGLLLVECETSIDGKPNKLYGWLTVIEANLAFWNGETDNAIIECVVAP